MTCWTMGITLRLSVIMVEESLPFGLFHMWIMLHDFAIFSLVLGFAGKHLVHIADKLELETLKLIF